MTLTSSIFGVPCLALANLTTGGTGATILTRILYHDRMGRLFGIVTANSAGAVLSRHGYTLDKAGRRTRATRENGQRWDYDYDDVGQVTSGVKKFPADDPIPGHSFAYQYDGIGNRTTATHGGANTAVTYTTNALNQYEVIQTEGGRFILGEAPPADPVIINGDTQNPAARPGGLGFYWKQITADNSSGPLWSTDTVESGGVTITGQAWTPAASMAPGYDFDGNLTNDGRWDYVWDAENRLIRMTTTATAANVGVLRLRLDFVYDSQGRRVSKTVSTSPDGATWTVATNRRFLYDGWNLIAEYSASSPTSTTLTLEASYLWGPDLSGTMQGAGGVGGLLAVRLLSSVSESSVYPAYDGNGNISAWISASGTLLARMDYSPFAQLVAHHKFASDNILSRLPFGFSTKYTDPEAGLLYYGHRYYDPVHGRWCSRDPIGERGGVNLYGFVGNDGIGWLDILGKAPTSEAEYVIIKTKTSLDLKGVGAAFYDPNDKKFWEKLTGSGITPEQWLKKLLGPDTTLLPMKNIAGFLDQLENLPKNQKIAILDHGAYDTKSGHVSPYIGESVVEADADWDKLAIGLAKVAREVVFCGCNMGRGPDEDIGATSIGAGSEQNMNRLAGLCELGPTVIASNVVNIARVNGPSTSFVPTLDTNNLQMEGTWFRFEKMSKSDFRKLSPEDRAKYMDKEEKEHQILKVHPPTKLRK